MTIKYPTMVNVMHSHSPLADNTHGKLYGFHNVDHLKTLSALDFVTYGSCFMHENAYTVNALLVQTP